MFASYPRIAALPVDAPSSFSSAFRPDAAPSSPLSRLELRCPPLPQTLFEAMELIDEPEKLEVGPVTDMVQRDPIVVARLLHVVNSAYYGLRRTISSVDRAVVLLGPVAVAGIVMGMNMLKLRSVLNGPAAACFQGLIRHSVATAFLTRHLLEGPPRTSRRPRDQGRIGVSFTAGLLHDFGKIILVYNFPDKAIELYDRKSFSDQVVDADLREMEQLLFGCDHTEAGEFVARKLNFPDPLTEVIRLHHEPTRTSEHPEVDRLVRASAAANLTAKVMGYAFGESLSYEDCLDHPVWEVLIEKDRVGSSPEHVLDTLITYQEHLDQYVESMTLNDLPEDDDRLDALRKNLLS